MPPRIRHIAEIGLRVADLDKMIAFYEDVLGFEMHIPAEKHVFLKIGELDTPLGRIGHPLILALFKRDAKPEIKGTSLDHLAFEIPPEDYDEQLARFQAKGMVLRERSWPDTLNWRGRSFFFYDPEGNVIELIAAQEGE